MDSEKRSATYDWIGQVVDIIKTLASSIYFSPQFRVPSAYLSQAEYLGILAD